MSPEEQRNLLAGVNAQIIASTIRNTHELFIGLADMEIELHVRGAEFWLTKKGEGEGMLVGTADPDVVVALLKKLNSTIKIVRLTN